MKLIYIMGYGRSGSTLLDIVLGDNRHIVTTGALDNYHVWNNKNLLCACGEKMRECSYWGQVCQETRFSENDIKLTKRMESILSFFIFKSSKKVNKYNNLNNKLLNPISVNFAKNTIVDSSKTTSDCIYRPLMLSKFCDVNLKPIYLVRDPRAVVRSAMKKHGSPEREKNDVPLVRFLRALISWNFTNFLTLIIAKTYFSNFLLIRYEDFCKDPINELHRVEKFAGVDLSNVIRKINQSDPIDIGHNIGGNRLRFSKSIISIQEDNSWKRHMPKSYHYIVTIFSFCLIKIFKY